MLFGFLTIRYLQSKREARELGKAALAYRAALNHLKQQPTNADVKEQALQLGRAYSKLTRQRRGVTIFDEMALMNDINAATAGATIAPSNVEDRLRRLADLRSKGLIDDGEYTTQRSLILSGM